MQRQYTEIDHGLYPLLHDHLPTLFGATERLQLKELR